MIGRIPRWRMDWGRTDPFALRVFVPGVMGAGLLVSLAVLAGDAARRLTTGRSRDRHAHLAARNVAAAAAAAAGSPPPDRTGGLRRRAVYGVVAAAFLALAGYVLVGSTWNYIDLQWAEDEAWILSGSVVVALTFAWVGAAAAAVAVRWPSAPAFVWPLLRRTPLGARGGGGRPSPPR